MDPAHRQLTAGEALSELQSVRDSLIALAACLDPDQRIGPRHALVNPPLWELGHVIWFQEKWCLRRRATGDPNDSPLMNTLAASRLPWSDWLYDSSRIPHDARWEAPLPDWTATLDYATEVSVALADRLAGGWPNDDREMPYFVELVLLHEAMHVEAWWMQWQILGRDAPRPVRFPKLPASGGELEFPPGALRIGATGDHFAFDNECPPHTITHERFSIDRCPVSFAEFARFVDEGGYENPDWWTPAGWSWRTEEARRHPAAWRPHANQWQHRCFGRWEALPGEEAVRHVSAFEAEAYAAWRGRRLPRAFEWERAQGAAGFVPGGVWEWTASAFLPHPGFRPGPYADYSRPWFGDHRELRGGSVVSHPRLVRPGFRNFYLPGRHDPIAGFRTARSLAD